MAPRAKKSGHATEQDRPDVLKRRQESFDGQIDLDPERLGMGFPRGHCKTTTLVGDLTMRGMIATFAPSGAINRDACETYVGRVLVFVLYVGSDPNLLLLRR